MSNPYNMSTTPPQLSPTKLSLLRKHWHAALTLLLLALAIWFTSLFLGARLLGPYLQRTHSAGNITVVIDAPEGGSSSVVAPSAPLRPIMSTEGVVVKPTTLQTIVIPWTGNQAVRFETPVVAVGGE